MSSDNIAVQTICIELLTEGNAASFSEFFSLTHFRQNASSSFYHPDPNLSPEKLSTLKNLLANSENASHSNQPLQTYESLKKLALFFEAEKLSEKCVQYFRRALESAKLVDDKSYEIEACRNLGNALDLDGQHNLALQYHERSWQLTGTDTPSEYTLACSKVVSTRIKLAQRCESNSEYMDAIHHYKACLAILPPNYPNETDLKMNMNYKLGKSYYYYGDTDTSLKYLNSYADSCRPLNDPIRLGMAQVALASCYEWLNQNEQAISLLISFLEYTSTFESTATPLETVSMPSSISPPPLNSESPIPSEESYTSYTSIETPTLTSLRSQACNQLGSIYNKMGKHDLAVKYFDLYFSLSQSSSTSQNASSSVTYPASQMQQIKKCNNVSGSVQMGIAKANAVMKELMRIVVKNDEESLKQLVRWKAGECVLPSIAPAAATSSLDFQ